MQVDPKALLLRIARTTPAFTADDVRFKLRSIGVEVADDDLSGALAANGYEDLGNGNWRVSQSDTQARLEKLRHHADCAERCLRVAEARLAELGVDDKILIEEIQTLIRTSPLRNLRE